MKLTAILAHLNNVIGKNNDLILHCPEDLQHFKRTTEGCIVIMGRKTVESLPHKLKNRFVICLTTNRQYKNDKCDIILYSKEDVLNYVQVHSPERTVYIAGGTEIYDVFADDITEAIVTKFNREWYSEIDTTGGIMLPESINQFIINAKVGVVTDTFHTGYVTRYIKDYYPM